MKERTAAERVNNRILNNYGIDNSKARGKNVFLFLQLLLDLIFILMLN
jgi:hypothetical protein